MEASQENIGDELLRDENISIDDISENVEVDDDKISISSVEETSKMQQSVKRKFVPSKLTSFFNPVSKQAMTSSDHDESSHPTVSTDAGVRQAWTDHTRERDKARRREAERKRRAAHKSDTEKRRQKVIGNLFELEVDRRGIDRRVQMSDKDKQDVIAAVVAATKKPEKKKHKDTVEARATQIVGSDKLYYGELDSGQGPQNRSAALCSFS